MEGQSDEDVVVIEARAKFKVVSGCNVNVEIITSTHVLNKPEKSYVISFDINEATCACARKNAYSANTSSSSTHQKRTKRNQTTSTQKLVFTTVVVTKISSLMNR